MYVNVYILLLLFMCEEHINMKCVGDEQAHTPIVRAPQIR